MKNYHFFWNFGTLPLCSGPISLNCLQGSSRKKCFLRLIPKQGGRVWDSYFLWTFLATIYLYSKYQKNAMKHVIDKQFFLGSFPLMSYITSHAIVTLNWKLLLFVFVALASIFSLSWTWRFLQMPDSCNHQTQSNWEKRIFQSYELQKRSHRAVCACLEGRRGWPCDCWHQLHVTTTSATQSLDFISPSALVSVTRWVVQNFD